MSNATEICHVDCRSTGEQVLIKECRVYDYYMVGAGAHTLSNSVMVTSAANTIVVTVGGKTGEPCAVHMRQVTVVNRHKESAP